jgi:hypothetical protein
VLNIAKPLSYIEYKSHSFSILAAGDVNPGTFAVLALALIAIGG